ncbi:hypothetical protein DRO64_02015 [Candidatus Bathyarchaeota archaeon]|nr:MAG: hypothetical protein DRO64_02015 [Candidatus Bathyarchaeota archaeon]
MHIPGKPLDPDLALRSRRYLTAYCKAEYIWEVADKIKMPTLILHYPVILSFLGCYELCVNRGSQYYWSSFKSIYPIIILL